MTEKSVGFRAVSSSGVPTELGLQWATSDTSEGGVAELAESIDRFGVEDTGQREGHGHGTRRKNSRKSFCEKGRGQRPYDRLRSCSLYRSHNT
jgi:hypothetical protein